MCGVDYLFYGGYMKLIKIIIDILMLVFVILSIIRWDGDPTFHIVAGSGCTLFFAIHLWLNIKPFKAMTRKFIKLNKKMKLQYGIDLVLILVWSVVIISGFIALPSYLSEVETAFKIGRLHGIFARVGCGFIVIHVVQHFKQILSYFRRKQKNKRDVIEKAANGS